jgi:hypothetical protein
LDVLYLDRVSSSCRSKLYKIVSVLLVLSNKCPSKDKTKIHFKLRIRLEGFFVVPGQGIIMMSFETTR